MERTHGVFNWLFARHQQGGFLLRIEDTDKERSKPEYTQNILEGLQWLGIDWDEEPVIQSERVAQHRDAIATLLEKAWPTAVTPAKPSWTPCAKPKDATRRPATTTAIASSPPSRPPSRGGRDAVIRFRIDDDAEIRWDDLVRGPMRWRGADLGGDMVVARRAPPIRSVTPFTTLWWWWMTRPWRSAM